MIDWFKIPVSEDLCGKRPELPGPELEAKCRRRPTAAWLSTLLACLGNRGASPPAWLKTSVEGIQGMWGSSLPIRVTLRPHCVLQKEGTSATLVWCFCVSQCAWFPVNWYVCACVRVCVWMRGWGITSVEETSSYFLALTCLSSVSFQGVPVCVYWMQLWVQVLRLYRSWDFPFHECIFFFFTCRDVNEVDYMLTNCKPQIKPTLITVKCWYFLQ